MSLAKLPRQLPALSAMLRDIGDPKPAAVAAALGVSERTVWRWIADDDAPRPALLALFWLTSWGWSAVEADARQTVNIARGMSEALTRERDALAAQNARLQALGDFGSANDPSAAPIVAPRAGFSPQRSIGELGARVGPKARFDAHQPAFGAHDPPKVRAE
jgi:predicted DNA-binding transcriptional regulator AlpA